MPPAKDNRRAPAQRVGNLGDVVNQLNEFVELLGRRIPLSRECLRRERDGACGFVICAIAGLPSPVTTRVMKRKGSCQTPCTKSNGVVLADVSGCRTISSNMVTLLSRFVRVPIATTRNGGRHRRRPRPIPGRQQRRRRGGASDDNAVVRWLPQADGRSWPSPAAVQVSGCLPHAVSSLRLSAPRSAVEIL